MSSKSTPLKVIAFDWGHTLMDEQRDRDVALDVRPIHLMPGVTDVLPLLKLPLALWANTRDADTNAVRHWIDRAGLSGHFQWVVTSVDAGARKPSPEFFRYALACCNCSKDDVLFVGNQLSSDIAGGEAFGIRTVWLSGHVHRSVDDAPCNAKPTHIIQTLYELPALIG